MQQRADGPGKTQAEQLHETLGGKNTWGKGGVKSEESVCVCVFVCYFMLYMLGGILI